MALLGSVQCVMTAADEHQIIGVGVDAAMKELAQEDMDLAEGSDDDMDLAETSDDDDLAEASDDDDLAEASDDDDLAEWTDVNDLAELQNEAAEEGTDLAERRRRYRSS